MPDSATASLSSLLRASTIDDHEEWLKAANAALKASKSDLKAHQTRVVALLKLDRFEDALRAIAEGGDKLDAVCQLEKAYALYKTGKLGEAGDIAKSLSGRSFSHMAAQVAYRDERFEDAIGAYEDLIAQSADAETEGSDLRINLLAAAAQLHWQAPGNETAHPGSEDTETFELTYNLACWCIARGEFTKASVLLRRAARLCDASDDLSDEEKQAEMTPILVQHAYVFSKLGKSKEALELHKSFAISRESDAETQAIAQNNVSALQVEHKNPFLALREAESDESTKNSARFFKYQESGLKRNIQILGLRAQKFTGVMSQTHRILAGHPSPSILMDINNLSVINAAAWCHRHSGRVSLADVLLLFDSRPTNVGLLLASIQLYLQAGNPGAALSTLESFFKKLDGDATPQVQDVRYSPGLVALAVSLYRIQGRDSSIRSELAKATSYWNQQDNHGVDSLLRCAGIELLKSSNSDDLVVSGQAFDKLCAHSHLDQTAAAGLVASFARSDRKKVDPYLPNLPSAESLIARVDIKHLLDGGVVSTLSRASQTRKRGIEADTADNSQKKRRKRKLPKNYEEGKKIDPERWLPLRDRASYRPKGKKGKKKANEATQGGFVKEEETLELVGGAGAVKVEKAPTASSKKKKKGKK